MSLAKLRKDIENTNFQILNILAKRSRLSKRLGRYKKKNKIKITNKTQEKEVFRKIRAKSRKLKLNPKFTKDLFRLITKESKRLQK